MRYKSRGHWDVLPSLKCYSTTVDWDISITVLAASWYLNSQAARGVVDLNAHVPVISMKWLLSAHWTGQAWSPDDCIATRPEWELWSAPLSSLRVWNEHLASLYGNYDKYTCLSQAHQSWEVLDSSDWPLGESIKIKDTCVTVVLISPE